MTGALALAAIVAGGVLLDLRERRRAGVAGRARDARLARPAGAADLAYRERWGGQGASLRGSGISPCSTPAPFHLPAAATLMPIRPPKSPELQALESIAAALDWIFVALILIFFTQRL